MTSDKNLSTSDGQIFVPSDVLVFPSDVLALAIKLVYKSSASTSEKNLSTSDLRFFQRYRGRKKGIEEKFFEPEATFLTHFVWGKFNFQFS